MYVTASVDGIFAGNNNKDDAKQSSSRYNVSHSFLKERPTGVSNMHYAEFAKSQQHCAWSSVIIGLLCRLWSQFRGAWAAAADFC